MATNDGIASLIGANDAARRSARKVPPPRHPRKQPAAPAAEPKAVVLTEDAEPAPQDRAAASTAPVPEPAAAPTIARSVQLDDASEDLLDRIRTAGRRQRVDANRSAVIRFALRQLEAQLSPEQVAAALKKNAGNQPKGAGRRAL